MRSEILQDLQTSLAINKQTAAQLLQGKQQILAKLQQNQQKAKLVQSLIQQRNAAQARALINQQIATQFHRKRIEIIQDYQQKITQMRYQIDRKQRILKELQSKQREVKSSLDYQQKNQDLYVVQPTTSILNLHIKVQQHRDLMQRLARDLYCLQKLKDLVYQKCETIWQQAMKVHALIKNPNNLKPHLQKTDLLKIPSPRRDFSLGQDDIGGSSSDDSVQQEVFPEKHKFQTQGRSLNIPSLDLSKVTPQGVNTSYKPPSKSQLERNVEERISQLTENIRYMRKELDSYTVKLVEVSDQNQGLLQENEGIVMKYQEKMKQIEQLKMQLRRKCAESESIKTDYN